MGASVYELSLLLTLKDMASAGLGRFEGQLRRLGPESRRALEDFKALREGMQRGLALGGAGVATLALLKKGVDAAANYEAAITDMRVAFAETGRDGAAEMNKLVAVGERLGQRLPGTTQDFLELFTAMKQGGIATQVILDGAGEAVAHLAVTMKRAPKELAEPFAAFGQQFQLAGQDYVKLTDLMSRARATAGILPEEIIMASKYAQTRGGLPLGFKGLEGASTMISLLTLLRRSGMSGEQAGTNLATFMSRLTLETTAQQNTVKWLEQMKGIKLNFFDDQGQFAGVENMMRQVEKLRGLDPKTRIGVMRALFEAEGAGVANIFAEGGLSSLQATNEEMSRKIGLTKEISAQTATYNAKMEALLGTLANVKAITFTPMLDTLKPLADLLNRGAGALQDFAKEHQGVARMVTTLAGLAGISLTVVGGFQAMRAAWGLWKIASAVGAGETALLGSLRATGTAAAATGVQLEGAAGKAGRLSGALKAIAPMVKVAVVIAGMEQFFTAIEEIRRRKQEFEGRSADVRETYESLFRSGKLYNYRAPESVRREMDEFAPQIVESLKLGRALEFSLQPERAGLFEHFWTYQRPYDNWWSIKSDTRDAKSSTFDPQAFAKILRESQASVALGDPNVLAGVIRYVRAGAGDLQLNADAIQNLLRGFQAAKPDEFARAMALVAEQEKQAAASANNLSLGLQRPLTPLEMLGYSAQQPVGPLNQFTALTQQTAGPLGRMSNALNPMPGDLSRFRLGLSNASSGLNLLGGRFSNFQLNIPTPQFGSAPPSGFGFGSGAGAQLNGPFNVITPKTKAAGGRVRSDGLVFVHRGEDITPADVTSRYEAPPVLQPLLSGRRGSGERSAPSVTLNYSPVVTINGAGPQAKEEFGRLLAAHKDGILRMLSRELAQGRERA
jgi:TP901 family phage tail tape measure protein